MSFRAPDPKEPVVLLDRRPEGRCPDMSIIVPCKNEARFIADCLSSIREHIPADITYELIVVDNESTDNSVDIARLGGADVILSHRGKVGEGRNLGAMWARAGLLLFIDADIVLTEMWGRRVRDRWRGWIGGESDALWGSWCAVPEDATWIERFWFEPMRYGRKTHLNGAHVVVRADVFHRLGGFNSALETGEDYELCARAANRGCPLLNCDR